MWKAIIWALMACTVIDALAFDSVYRAQIFHNITNGLHEFGQLDWTGFLD